jgi:hypothetical protein
MTRTALGAIALLAFAHTAAAAPTWSAIAFTTTPQNAPHILAAAEKLMSSPVGKGFPGRLLLQLHVADGNNPATHSFIPIYKTHGEREAFVGKLQADPAWDTFMAAMTKHSQPVSTVLNQTVKSWGEMVDTDHVWMGHAFTVRDPAAFVAAADAFMATPTGKKFPGQVHLSATVAGGLSPVTHTISVGYASEAEMGAWNATAQASADWAAYIAASRKAADYLGGSLARDIKWWGPATLAELTGN